MFLHVFSYSVRTQLPTVPKCACICIPVLSHIFSNLVKVYVARSATCIRIHSQLHRWMHVYILSCAMCIYSSLHVHMLHIKCIYLYTCTLQIYNSSTIWDTHNHTHVCSHAPMCVHTHFSCLYMYASLCTCICDYIYIYIYIFVCMCPHLAHTHTCTLPSVHLSAIAFTSHKCKCLCMHILPQTNGMQCPVSLPSLLSWGLTL